jgi:hypothetical protein
MDIPEGFTPILNEPGKKGITPTVKPSETKFVSRPLDDGSIDVRPRTELSIDEPTTGETFTRPQGGGALHSAYNRGLDLSCEAKQTGSSALTGKCSGKATHTVSGSDESDLTTIPWALCPRHIGQVQKKLIIDQGRDIKITPITPAYVEKHRARVLAVDRGLKLSMEGALRTGGIETNIPADAEKPGVSVNLNDPGSLLYGRSTEKFGVRGPATITHLQRVKQRRTAPEAETILSNALIKLRADEKTPEERDKDLIAASETAMPDTDRRTGKWMPWSFKARNAEGLLRANKAEFVRDEHGNIHALPGGREDVDHTSTYLADVPEEPRKGTNVKDLTVNSVDIGSRQDIVKALPAHLQTHEETPRELTPLERFSEAHYDENILAAESQSRVDEIANRGRNIEAIKNMTREQRAALEKEIRSKKALEFKQGQGNPELE